MNVTVTFCAIFAFGAALMDVWWEKVPNFWSACGLASSVLLRIGMWRSGSWTGSLWEIPGGMLLPVLLLFPLFAAKMLGTGDVKVFAVLGSMMGTRNIFYCMTLSFLLGAAIAAPVLFLFCDYRRRILYFLSYVRRAAKTKTLPPYLTPGNSPENMHFTIPIFGSVWLLILGGYL